MKFNTLSHNEKLDIQKEILSFVDILGGLGNFYALLDSVKDAKQHPLLNKTSKFHFKGGTIVWQKEIYKDKVDTIFDALKTVQSSNILEIENEKLKKQILNTIRTLGKLKFTITMEDKDIFEFEPFKTISESNIELDVIFQIVFFDSINNTKKILKYK